MAAVGRAKEARCDLHRGHPRSHHVAVFRKGHRQCNFRAFDLQSLSRLECDCAGYAVVEKRLADAAFAQPTPTRCRRCDLRATASCFHAFYVVGQTATLALDRDRERCGLAVGAGVGRRADDSRPGESEGSPSIARERVLPAPRPIGHDWVYSSADALASPSRTRRPSPSSHFVTILTSACEPAWVAAHLRRRPSREGLGVLSYPRRKSCRPRPCASSCCSPRRSH